MLWHHFLLCCDWLWFPPTQQWLAIHLLFICPLISVLIFEFCHPTCINYGFNETTGPVFVSDHFLVALCHWGWRSVSSDRSGLLLVFVSCPMFSSSGSLWAWNALCWCVRADSPSSSAASPFVILTLPHPRLITVSVFVLISWASVQFCNFMLTFFHFILIVQCVKDHFCLFSFALCFSSFLRWEFLFQWFFCYFCPVFFLSAVGVLSDWSLRFKRVSSDLILLFLSKCYSACLCLCLFCSI